MDQCVMCPEGKCSADCPILDVLPYHGPLVKENIRKCRKLTASGMKREEIKEKLGKVGDVDAKNNLIDEWIEKYESSEKDPMYYILKDSIKIIKQQRLIADQEKALDQGKKLLKTLTDAVDATKAVYEEAIANGASVSVVGDESAPVDHADESLPSLKSKEKMMVECCLCPEGGCSADCPTLDVLPYDGPLLQENILKARKLSAYGMKIQDIKEKLRKAGDLDAKNKLIDKWIEEYHESRDKDPFYHIMNNRLKLIKQQQLLAERKKVLAEKQNMIKSAEDVLKAVTAVYEETVSNGAPASVASEGLRD